MNQQIVREYRRKVSAAKRDYKKNPSKENYESVKNAIRNLAIIRNGVK